ncbi:type I-E CRISPR-associated protein Cse1/CasA [Actinoalloteichus caeruleus]|uniref:type I-E CRISPR-associated protein Cse1/CasA n=1 Tax=Actinoalloteichus cyanogriseus TaxID=2893586 RepID=UPI003BB98720
MADDGLFDLTTEGWIPVRWQDNVPDELRKRTHLGLREVLSHAHRIEGLLVPVPPAESALLRVLYALTARITGLDRMGDGLGNSWPDRRLDIFQRGSFDGAKISSYFAREDVCFRLYDPVRPFLQDPRLAEECKAGAGPDKLVVTRPSGGNHAWFSRVDPRDPSPVTSGDGVLNLLVWRYYGPSGTCTPRVVGGKPKGNMNAGPLRSALSYHPETSTLFGTLLAGLPEPAPDTDPARDLCPWEREDLPNPLAPPRPPSGPCSMLTDQAQQAVLLVPDATGQHVADCYVTWAHYDKLPVEDPYLIWQTSSTGNRYARPADAGRALWRDLDALLLEEPKAQTKPRRPDVFRTAGDIADETRLRVRALGFDQDGQAKDRQFVRATTPPIFDLFEERDAAAANAVGALRQLGERYGWRLGRAAFAAWKAVTDADKIDYNKCAWVRQTAARYWPAAETEFWRRIRDTDMTEAARAFRRLAETAYDEVTRTACATARGARAVEMARVELYGGNQKKKGTGRKGRPADTEDGAGDE